MFGVIGQRQRFFLGFETQHAQHWGKQFGINDVQMRTGTINDRRFKEHITALPRRPLATTQHLAALFNRQRHFAFGGFKLAIGAQRSHLGFIQHRVADLRFIGDLDHPLQKLVRNVLVQDQPRPGDTALTRGCKNSRNRSIHCAFDLRILKDDEGRFAAKLQRHFGKVLGRVHQNMLGRDRPTGEGYPRHQSM